MSGGSMGVCYVSETFGGGRDLMEPRHDTKDTSVSQNRE